MITDDIGDQGVAEYMDTGYRAYPVRAWHENRYGSCAKTEDGLWDPKPLCT